MQTLAPFIGLIEGGQVRKVAVLLSVVETIPDDKPIRDLKPTYSRSTSTVRRSGLLRSVQTFSVRGFRLDMCLDKMLNGQARIDDILNQQHVLSGYGLREVGHQFYLA